jgi:hypothetical protein
MPFCDSENGASHCLQRTKVIYLCLYPVSTTGPQHLAWSWLSSRGYLLRFLDSDPSVCLSVYVISAGSTTPPHPLSEKCVLVLNDTPSHLSFGGAGLTL